MIKSKKIIGITSIIIVLGIICTLLVFYNMKQTKLKEEARIAENLRNVEASRLRDEKRRAERKEREKWRKEAEAKAVKKKAEEDAEWAELKLKYDCNGNNCLSVCSYSQMEKWVAGNNSYENCKYVYYRTGTYKNLYHKELSLRAFRRGQNER